MKLDSEQVFYHSALGHKPDSKTFEYHDNPLDSTGPKSGNGIMKDNQNGALCELKGNEGGDADRIPLVMNDGDGWTASKLDCSISVDDFTNDNEKEVRDFVAPYSHSSRKMESLEKDSVFYMDKSVMECDLPELVVCYKESTFHVKDICIDEGVPSQDKFLFVSGVDEKGVCTFLPSEKDQNSELVNERGGIDVLDVLKFTAEIDLDKDISNPCDSKDLMLTGEAKDDATDKIVHDVSKEMPSLGALLSMHESGRENFHSKFLDNDSDEVEQHSVQASGEKAISASTALVSAVEESNNCSEEAILVSPALVSATEKSNDGSEEAILASRTLVSTSEESTSGCLVNELSYNSKVETGSITFDFDSSTPTSSGREDCPQNLDSKCLETKSMPGLEDANNSQPASGQVQYGHGESSFSMTGPLSGLITYSGHIAYSGSLSLRSDSSTTSTRSFAFPVLQSEWNSSPVRMAKADRRHFRKHRCWRQGLLCCRF